jgi:hypothetical protein
MTGGAEKTAETGCGCALFRGGYKGSFVFLGVQLWTIGFTVANSESRLMLNDWSTP